jgi:hypothetical protein
MIKKLFLLLSLFFGSVNAAKPLPDSSGIQKDGTEEVNFLEMSLEDLIQYQVKRRFEQKIEISEDDTFKEVARVIRIKKAEEKVLHEELSKKSLKELLTYYNSKYQSSSLNEGDEKIKDFITIKLQNITQSELSEVSTKELIKYQVFSNIDKNSKMGKFIWGLVNQKQEEVGRQEEALFLKKASLLAGFTTLGLVALHKVFNS